MADEFLNFRLIKRLPVTVVGPSTRWFVSLEYYGKNGCRASLMARCLSNGNSVVLADGRESWVSHLPYKGVLVKQGTVQAKIAAAMVAQGNAEFIDQPLEEHLW